MRLLSSFFAVILFVTSGCATTVPRTSTIGDVEDAPETYRNKLVEVHGRVVQYREPKGDVARTWKFSVQDKDGRVLRVFTDRRSADDIAAADDLVERAANEGGLLFVAGYVRVGEYRNTSGPARLDLRQVAYDEEVIKLRSRRADSPYRGQVSVGFGVGHHHGFHHGYHYRHGHYWH